MSEEGTLNVPRDVFMNPISVGEFLFYQRGKGDGLGQGVIIRVDRINTREQFSGGRYFSITGRYWPNNSWRSADRNGLGARSVTITDIKAAVRYPRSEIPSHILSLFDGAQ